ncbi:MAG: PAS domain-containing protein [Chloroflexi bacterium]|nr:PAS domain-containing protein [Chloroflexota bacterium]
MKIRTQFFITMALFFALLTIIGSSLFITNQQVNHWRKQEDIAHSVERDARDLSYLSNDYLLYRESQQRARWEVKYAELTQDIANLQVDTPEQQAILNNIKSNGQRLQAVFNDVVALFQSTPFTRDTTTELSFIQVSWSRMEVQNQAMIFDALLLAQKTHEQQEQAQSTNLLMLFGLVAIFGIYFINNYLFIYRNLLNAMAELSAGTRVIGSGNLNFKIPVQHKDEIGELSLAFNQMTANLKQVTASKAELEKEITERIIAEEALAASEERFATTLASVGDAVIATDTERRITFMNRVAEQLTGWTIQECLLKPAQDVFNIINEETRKQVSSPLDRVVKEGTIVGLANHTVLIRQDGVELPIDDSAAPIRDRRGNITGAVLIFRDITERKKTEKELARLASFPLRNPHPTVETDWTGCLHYINPAAHHIFPDLEQKGADHPWFMDWQAATQTFREGNLTPIIRDVTLGERSYQQVLYYLPDIERIRIYGMDITERKRAEEALRESERRERARAEELATFLDMAPTPVFIVHNPEGNRITGNRAADEFLRNPRGAEASLSAPAETRPQHFRAVKDGRELTTDELPAQRAARGVQVKDFEFSLVFVDGTTRNVVGYATPLRDEQGQPRGAVHILVDITQRKGAEEALRESEEKYRNLFTNMTEEVHFWKLIHNEDGTIKTWQLVDANPPTLKTWAKPLEEIRGKTMDEIFGPGATEHYMPIVQKVMSEGAPYSYEDYFPNLDKYFRFTTVPLGDHFITTGADITQIKKAEIALRESEERFRLVLKNAPVVVANLNRDLKYTWVFNPRGGLTPDEVIGKRVGLSTDPEATRRITESLEQLLDSGIPTSWEGESKGNTGLLSFETYAEPLRNVDGAITGIALVALDITERKRAEEILRKSEQRYRSLFENMLNGFAYCRMLFLNNVPQDFTYLAVNRAFETLTGLQDVVGKQVTQVIPGIKESNPELFEIYGRVVLTGKPEYFETYVAPLGSWFSISVYSPEPEHFVAIFDNITGRKQAEHAIRQLNEQLEQRVTERTAELEASNRELEAFAYSVSHDLRTPLRAIDSYSRILLEDYGSKLDDEGKRICNVVSNQAQRMGQLIDELLTFSRLGRAEMSATSIDMTLLATSVFNELTTPASRSRIDCRIGPLLPAIGDPTLLRQVWTNLISNALKFSGRCERAVIEIESKQDQTKVIYSVRDNGAGFDMRYVNKLFGVFQRLHSEREFEGNGVGLANVQRIIHRHGGHVWAESQLNQGATFYFALPLARSAPSPEA